SGIERSSHLGPTHGVELRTTDRHYPRIGPHPPRFGAVSPQAAAPDLLWSGSSYPCYNQRSPSGLRGASPVLWCREEPPCLPRSSSSTTSPYSHSPISMLSPSTRSSIQLRW